jgi:hypothetical protein
MWLIIVTKKKRTSEKTKINESGSKQTLFCPAIAK